MSKKVTVMDLTVNMPWINFDRLDLSGDGFNEYVVEGH